MHKIKTVANFRTGFCSETRDRNRLDMNRKLFLRHEGKKTDSSMTTNDLRHWMIASLKISTDKQNEAEQRLCLITKNTITIPPYHISPVPLKAINQAINTKIKSEALLEIGIKPVPNHRTGNGTDTNTTKTRVQSTRCIHDSTMKPRWSNCNIEKENDPWLCKGIGLHGKRLPRAKQNCRINDLYMTPQNIF